MNLEVSDEKKEQSSGLAYMPNEGRTQVAVALGHRLKGLTSLHWHGSSKSGLSVSLTRSHRYVQYLYKSSSAASRHARGRIRLDWRPTLFGKQGPMIDPSKKIWCHQLRIISGSRQSHVCDTG